MLFYNLNFFSYNIRTLDTSTMTMRIPVKLYLRPTITGLFSITCVMLLINQFAFAATSPGDLDLTFGTSGRVTTDFGSQQYDVAHAVALQPDGKIVVAGELWSDSSGEDFAVARYMDNGQLDPTFGVTGKVSTDLEGIDAAMSLAIQTDGKIVVAGLAAYGQKLGLVRYKPDGSLDPTFGTMGKVISDFSTSYATAFAVLIQADGKIVAAGCTNSTAQTDFLAVRYNADGHIDGTFGQNGLGSVR